jgi:hypothetical protein
MNAAKRPCDVCQDPRLPAKTYTLTSQGRSVSTDRCAEHAAPLEQVFDNGGKGRCRDGRQRISTLEQIEEKRRNRRE